MVCKNCQAEVPGFPFCPYCGHRQGDPVVRSTDGLASSISQRDRVLGRPPFRRWVLPVMFLLVIIAFGVLGLALTGFRDGIQDRNTITQHQAEIHYYQGLVYLERGQYQLAEASFEEAVRLVPSYAEAEKERLLARAKQTTTPSPTPQPTFTATPTPIIPTPTPEVVVVPVTQVLFEQALARYENGEWGQAISRLERLRDEDPTYRSEQVTEMLFHSHRQYAMELEQEGSLEEAISHYDSALDQRRRDPEVEERRQRADLYVRALDVWNANWERVIVNLTALYALAPDYKDVAERLYEASTTYGQLMVKRERYCDAAELFEQALRIHDDDLQIVKLEDDTSHLCRVAGPTVIETPSANGYEPADVHIGTLVMSCYDHRSNQYDICAQNAADNVLETWIAHAEQPAFTLDGKALAYRSTDPDRPGLYAITLVDSTAISDTVSLGQVFTVATESTLASPTWSPDGTRLAYSQYDVTAEEWVVYVALVGSNEPPRRIHQGEWPNWGANGLLAFTTCSAPDTCGIHAFDLRSWQLRKLTDSVQDRAAAWSPTGDELAYMSDVGRSFNLYVAHVDPQSVTIRQITRNLFKDGMPVWAPDGDRIAFVSNRDDQWSVYTLHPFGDQEKYIATLGAESADWLRFQLAWISPVIHFSAEE